MNETDPTLEEWKKLYERAAAFKQLESWNWMYDSDLFGVQDENYEEIGYCCVLGKIKEVFALVVYLGTEGLNGYLSIQSGEAWENHQEALDLQNCLIASFEDRKTLDRRDLDIINRLGLLFKGQNGWPMFRNYKPGYAPWYLTKKEINFLALVLEQAGVVAGRLRKNRSLLIPSEEGLYFVRASHRRGNRIEWQDKWLKPAPIAEHIPILNNEKSNVLQLNEIRLQKIRQNLSHGPKSWEIDWLYSPSAVIDKERPYYPIFYLCVDTDSSFILDFSLFENKQRGELEYREKLLDIFEKHGVMPDKILVKKKEVYDLVNPIAKRLEIGVEFQEYLKNVEEVKESLLNSLNR